MSQIFLCDESQCVRLLPGGTCRGPYSQVLGLQSLVDPWENSVMIERKVFIFSHEIGVVGGELVNDIDQLIRIIFQGLEIVHVVGVTVFRNEIAQSSFDKRTLLDEIYATEIFH